MRLNILPNVCNLPNPISGCSKFCLSLFPLSHFISQIYQFHLWLWLTTTVFSCKNCRLVMRIRAAVQHIPACTALLSISMRHRTIPKKYFPQLFTLFPLHRQSVVFWHYFSQYWSPFFIIFLNFSSHFLWKHADDIQSTPMHDGTQLWADVEENQSPLESIPGAPA